jgi:hypothetical protein
MGTPDLHECHVVPLQNVEEILDAPLLAEGIVHDHVIAGRS